MKPLQAGFMAAMLIATGGCGAPDDRPALGPDGSLVAAQADTVELRRRPVGTAPNNGLLLPVVSPDCRSVACLRLTGDNPPAPDDFFSGGGLERMSLEIRALAEGSQWSVLCAGGATWPAWSRDSGTLAFATFAADGAGISVYDMGSRKLRRIRCEAPIVAMPVPENGGRRVAYLSAVAAGEPLQLQMLDASGVVRSCPLDDAAEQHLYPRWTADGQIVYVSTSPGGVTARRWNPAARSATLLCELPLPRSPAGQFQAFAGIPHPLSPAASRIALYDAADDRIVLVDLADGRRTSLAGGTQSGCWSNDRTFVAATRTAAWLFDGLHQAISIHEGPALPLAGMSDPRRVILCLPADQPRSFRLVIATMSRR